MSPGFFGKVLKPLGLYRVNSDYIKVEKKQLSEIATSLAAVSRRVDSAAQVIAAIQSDNHEKAVPILLKIAAPDEHSVRLKEAQVRLKSGEKLKAVIGAVRSPELGQEIASSLRQVMAEARAEVDRGRFDLDVVGENLNRKVQELEGAAENWSMGEKLATPDAVRAILKKATDARARANRIEEKVATMEQGLDGLHV